MFRKFLYAVSWVLILSVCALGVAVAQTKQQKLNTLFDTLSNRQNFNGCVLISDQGQVLLQAAYGIGGTGTPGRLTNESRFEIGSITKAFTAISIMQLKEKGLLRYDDSLTRFLPQLPFPGVTIKHLLSNTSGIEEFLSWTEREIDISVRQSNASIIRALSERKMRPSFAPGQDFQYCNTNYLLLASIVEIVANMPFNEYLSQNIFKPCGMQNTSVNVGHASPLPPDYAYDYSWDGGQNRLVRTDSLKRYTKYMSGIKGAYGILTTTGDLFRWVQALSDHKLVSEATFNETVSPVFIKSGTMVAEIDPGIPYAAGWLIMPGGSGPDNIFSSGNYGGYTSLVVRDLSSKRTVILLSNSNETTDVVGVMNHIDETLESERFSFPELSRPKRGISLSEKQLRSYSGKYLATKGDSDELHIVFANSRLYGKFSNFMEQNLFPETENVLFANGVKSKLVFKRGTDGKVLGFTLTGPGIERYFEKAR
jgi:CubicO group peptidase (beta-lactamase class C family)